MTSINESHYMIIISPTWYLITLVIISVSVKENKMNCVPRDQFWSDLVYSPPGGVRHDPQRFMGETVYVPHFFTSHRSPLSERLEQASGRDESKPGIKTLLPFLKDITEECDLENFQDLILALDACYWLHKVISISLSRFGDDGRCDFNRF